MNDNETHSGQPITVAATSDETVRTQPTVEADAKASRGLFRRSTAHRLPWAVAVVGVTAGLILATGQHARSTTSGPVPVQLTGTAPVSEVHSDAKQPFLTQLSVPLTSTDYIGERSFTVPAGKRLVIEHVNAEANMGGSNDVPDNIRIYSIFNGGGYYIQHFPFISHEPNTNSYLSNDQTEFFADGGTTVYVDMIRYTPGTTASMDVTITGYLENAS